MGPLPKESFSLWGTVRGGKKNQRKPLLKTDIGQPTNFVHKLHVGWDNQAKDMQFTSDGDFLDSQLEQQILQMLGRKNDILNAKEKREIYQVNIVAVRLTDANSNLSSCLFDGSNQKIF